MSEPKTAAPATSVTKTAPKKNLPVAKKTSKPAKAKQLTLDISNDANLGPFMKDLPQNIRTRLALINEMKKYGFKKEEIQGLLRDVYKQFVTQENTIDVASTFRTARVSYKDATQMVPVSNIQASSMTPNFETVRSFFLTGHQKHPDFTNYTSAEEIGKLVNKTSDQMKDPIKKYVNGLGHDLPNNMVTKAVIEAGGYFKGIASLMDKHNLPVVNIPEVGMATWFMMEDGKIVWRNYWHPSVVQGIMNALGFPTLSELPDPEKFREHNPSTK
jgi:hypothetical protein